MPFTFSHPAIVLPLRYLPKPWYSLTGLIVGSTAPDFEYFFRLNIQSIYSHTLLGVLYFDLPIGLLLCFIYHSFVRNAFINNIPTVISEHLTPFKALNWNTYFKQNWLVVLISIIIGSLSHILWDGFTHVDGYFVQLYPFLKQTVLKTDHFRLQLYTVVQHLSSLLGMLYILFYIKMLPKSVGKSATFNFKYWGVVVSVSATITILRYLLGSKMVFGDVLVTLVAAGLCGVLLASFVVGNKNEVSKV